MKVKELQNKTGNWEILNTDIRNSIVSQYAIQPKLLEKLWEELESYDSVFIEFLEDGTIEEFYLMEGIIPELEKEILPVGKLIDILEKEN